MLPEILNFILSLFISIRLLLKHKNVIWELTDEKVLMIHSVFFSRTPVNRRDSQKVKKESVGHGRNKWVALDAHTRWAGTSQGPRVKQELKRENEGREASLDVVLA